MLRAIRDALGLLYWSDSDGPLHEGEMAQEAERRRLAAQVQGVATVALALGIFALDVLSPLQGAVAVLYTIVVLLTTRANTRGLTLAAGLVCALLAIAGYFISHDGEVLGSAAMRLAVALVAIGVTSLLSVRHQAAAEHRRIADQRYRAIFNAAGFPIWEGDWSEAFQLLRGKRAPDAAAIDLAARTATIGDANHAAAALFGLGRREELIGGTLLPFHTPAAEATLGRILEAMIAGETTIEEETRFVTAQGEPVDVLLRVTIPPQRKEWQQVLVMALDVTERNQTNARLAQAQAQLTHVSRITTLGQLAASIAHEVNQPLSALITYAKSGKRWLAREAPDAVEVADCLDHVVSNGTRAADVIARIRALARRADPRQDAIDLGSLVSETIELLRRDLNTHDVTVEVRMPDGLPPLVGDRVQMQQVLMNLMLNAEQAMAQVAPGARVLCVEVTAAPESVAVHVRDSGSGISVEPESLFSPFFTTKSEGMGMGLSICRSIIESHGGTLGAENHPEGGAVFSFRLPVASAMESAA